MNPFGYSEYLVRGPGVQHRFRSTHMGSHDLITRWQCGAISAHAVLRESPHPTMAVCAGCGDPSLPNRHVVYFGERGGLIKIGTSRNVAHRVHALGLDLLATEPGDRDRETQLHRMFRECRADTPGEVEWFHPTPDLMAYIGGLS